LILPSTTLSGHHDLAGTPQTHPTSDQHVGINCGRTAIPGFQEGSGQTGYCFRFGFGTAAKESVCVRALDLDVRFRCLSDGLSPPLCFSSIFNQSGMTIALISSCTVMSLSSAIFRSFVYAESPKDCMNLDESVTPHERCRYYLPEPQFH